MEEMDKMMIMSKMGMILKMSKTIMIIFSQWPEWWLCQNSERSLWCQDNDDHHHIFSVAGPPGERWWHQLAPSCSPQDQVADQCFHWEWRWCWCWRWQKHHGMDGDGFLVTWPNHSPYHDHNNIVNSLPNNQETSKVASTEAALQVYLCSKCCEGYWSMIMIIMIIDIIWITITMMIMMIMMMITGGWQSLCLGVPPREDVERPARDGFAPPLQVGSCMIMMINLSRWSWEMPLLHKYRFEWFMAMICH